MTGRSPTAIAPGAAGVTPTPSTGSVEPRPATDPVRVLHVYAGNLYGGVERMLLTVHQHRRFAPGLVSDFALCFNGRLREELIAEGATLHDLGPVRLSRPWTVLRARRRLRDLIAHGQYQVCVTHSGWLAATLGPAIRMTSSKWVGWIHGELGANWIDRLAARCPPDALILNSRHIEDRLHATGPRSHAALPARVIYCPVPMQPPADHEVARSGIRRDLGCPADACVVVCCARMEPIKGHPLLINALSRLVRSDYQCWIVGGAQRASEQAYLREIAVSIRRAGLADQVRILGERSDVPAVLCAADIYCQANAGPESFGISFVEALAAGLPVVTTRMGGGAEIVQDGVCGFLTPPGDPQALADALGRLIDDPALRRRLGDAGPARALELCDPAARVRDVEAALLSAVEGAR